MGHVGSSRTNLPDLIRSEKGSGTEKGGKTSLFSFYLWFAVLNSCVH